MPICPATTPAACCACTTTSRAFLGHINTLGWGNYANDHEDANGQFEQNFRYADALTTADRLDPVPLYRAHGGPARAGMRATFMPKPFTQLTGNGLHTPPQPLVGRRRRRAGRGDRRPARPRSFPRWPTHWIGGLLEHARSIVSGHLPDGQLLTTHRRPPAPARARPGPPSLSGLRRQQPHPPAPRPRARPGRAPRRSTAPPTPTWPLAAMIGGRAGRGVDREIDPGPAELRQPVCPLAGRVGGPRHRGHAADVAAHGRGLGSRPHPRTRLGQDRRRRLRRLFRRDQTAIRVSLRLSDPFS